MADLSNIKKAEQLLLDQRIQNRREFICSAKEAQAGTYKPVLVLGAGVSMPAGLPGWQKLVSTMFGYSLINIRNDPQKQKDILSTDLLELEPEVIENLVAGNIEILSGNNVLETGQYIEEMLDGPSMEPWVRHEELKEVLTRIIDQGTSAKDALQTLPGSGSYCSLPADERAKLQNEWAKENTLQAVAYLLSVDHGFDRAITYNYDTYLEEYICEIYDAAHKLLVHVDGWNSHRFPGKSAELTEIFHVHGCVPTKYFREKPGRMENGPKETERIILSEDSYYEAEHSEPYNWMNSVQSNVFNQNTCIFVGFSGDDYNFRRILRQLGRFSRDTRPRHYMLVNIGGMYSSILDECEKKVSGKDKAEKYARILLDRVLMAKEIYWGRFGFYPIWAMKEEIPSVLLSLAPIDDHSGADPAKEKEPATVG